MSASPQLVARGLTRFTDSGRALLDDVSLAVAGGDRIAIRGASGSGKSLLLRALAQLDPVEGGEVLWRGEAVEDAEIPRFRSRVVYHQQHPGLEEGTVLETLERPFSLASNADRRFDRQAAERLLVAFGRDASLLDASVADLSGGERQIVALVRLLLVEPEIILLDEPTAALDPPTEDRVIEAIIDWAATDPQRALLWVSHDSRLAPRVANRFFVVEAGRLREERGIAGGPDDG